MGLVWQQETCPVSERKMEIHEQQTRTGHHGLKEGLGEGVREKGVEGELELLTLQE